MRGILLIVSMDEDETGLEFSTEISDAEGQTLEQALEKVIAHEETNINFDMEGEQVRGNPFGASDIVNELEKSLAKVKNLTWPAECNVDGHYVIESIWGGGLYDGGLEYRFVPIVLTR